MVKIDLIASLVSRGLEHVAEEILLMIEEPPDFANLQLVSKLVKSFHFPLALFTLTKALPPSRRRTWYSIFNTERQWRGRLRRRLRKDPGTISAKLLLYIFH